MPIAFASMVEGGKTPLLGRAELEDIGYKIAIFPASGFLAAAAALNAVYQHIAGEVPTKDADISLYPFSAFSKPMGFDEVWAFERRHMQD